MILTCATETVHLELPGIIWGLCRRCSERGRSVGAENARERFCPVNFMGLLSCLHSAVRLHGLDVRKILAGDLLRSNNRMFSNRSPRPRCI